MQFLLTTFYSALAQQLSCFWVSGMGSNFWRASGKWVVWGIQFLKLLDFTKCSLLALPSLPPPPSQAHNRSPPLSEYGQLDRCTSLYGQIFKRKSHKKSQQNHTSFSKRAKCKKENNNGLVQCRGRIHIFILFVQPAIN